MANASASASLSGEYLVFRDQKESRVETGVFPRQVQQFTEQAYPCSNPSVERVCEHITVAGDIARVMKLTPFLLFDGNCAEAMTFYQKCLGGELTLTKLGDTPMKDQMPPEHHNKITYAHLKSGAIEISATDWLHPTRTPKPGNTVCLYLSEATAPELRALFEKLSEGADPTLLDPLREMPFGSYGHLADQYGVHWFFQGENQA